MNQAGFTLIESMIVIGILSVMSGFLILYNRTSERQIILLEEKAKIISAIATARNLALGSLIEGSDTELVCGYGVHFNELNFFIFRDLAISCETTDHSYSGDSSEEKIASYSYTLRGRFRLAADSISNIFFEPPTPDIYIDGGEAPESSSIILQDASDPAITFTLPLNSRGELTL
ncbi:MAG: prepilin-type N-terminal cleavage/methylation domain-containing protein [Candidatus Harrisonbacteria bacterium]|nr:prepilin-type N-terminal cleavage/methylation domain-containing protein [Candidatus Harrisonbacteria bacterium]